MATILKFQTRADLNWESILVRLEEFTELDRQMSDNEKRWIAWSSELESKLRTGPNPSRA